MASQNHTLDTLRQDIENKLNSAFCTPTFSTDYDIRRDNLLITIAGTQAFELVTDDDLFNNSMEWIGEGNDRNSLQYLNGALTNTDGTAAQNDVSIPYFGIS